MKSVQDVSYLLHMIKSSVLMNNEEFRQIQGLRMYILDWYCNSLVTPTEQEVSKKIKTLSEELIPYKLSNNLNDIRYKSTALALNTLQDIYYNNEWKLSELHSLYKNNFKT